jgi:hypothetical protein
VGWPAGGEAQTKNFNSVRAARSVRASRGPSHAAILRTERIDRRLLDYIKHFLDLSTGRHKAIKMTGGMAASGEAQTKNFILEILYKLLYYNIVRTPPQSIQCTNSADLWRVEESALPMT